MSRLYNVTEVMLGHRNTGGMSRQVLFPLNNSWDTISQCPDQTGW
jgi:hypothetical protein